MEVPGELLLKANIIGVDELKAAEIIRDSSGGNIVDILIDRGCLTRGRFVETLKMRFGIEVIEHLTADMADPESLSLVPRALCREMGVLPLGLKGTNTLRLAMVDPTHIGNLDDVRFMTGLQVDPVLVSRSQLAEVLAEVHSEEDDLQSQMRELGDLELETGIADETTDEIDISKTEHAPVVALVNLLLKQGIVGLASDIHLETKEKHTTFL